MSRQSLHGGGLVGWLVLCQSGRLVSVCRGAVLIGVSDFAKNATAALTSASRIAAGALIPLDTRPARIGVCDRWSLSPIIGCQRRSDDATPKAMTPNQQNNEKQHKQKERTR